MNPVEWLDDNGLAIFLFHGVIEGGEYAVRNRTSKHLRRDTFDRIVRDLKECGRPLSMDDVVEHLDGGHPFPPCSFAITFDDGFENNASVAAPILEREEVPATFYLTTGFIQDNAMAWIDRIEHTLEHAPSARLRLPWAQRSITIGTADRKTAVLEEIRREAKTRPHLDLDGLAADIAGWCGVPPGDEGADPLDRKLTWEQVRGLDAHPLFTVGGHTHSHAVLSFLDHAGMCREIDTCLDLLDTETGRRPRHFSYPEGLVHSYSDEVIEALHERGMACAPTAEPGVNTQHADPFRLKRINVVE